MRGNNANPSGLHNVRKVTHPLAAARSSLIPGHLKTWSSTCKLRRFDLSMLQHTVLRHMFSSSPEVDEGTQQEPESCFVTVPLAWNLEHWMRKVCSNSGVPSSRPSRSAESGLGYWVDSLRDHGQEEYLTQEQMREAAQTQMTSQTLVGVVFQSISQIKHEGIISTDVQKSRIEHTTIQ